ncbi:MAG: MerR family transcriptional regulator [Rhodospirillales bacterium]|nr:MerR family transcriptional regulator [Rhodospirillales bacterium]
MDEDLDLTTEQTATLTGLTERQLDYWIREGVIEAAVGAHGSGSARRWSYDQVQILRLLAVLRDLGASLETLASVFQAAVDLSDRAWDARVLVTPDGRITTLLGGDANGYAVDLSLIRSSTVAETAERALAFA